MSKFQAELIDNGFGSTRLILRCGSDCITFDGSSPELTLTRHINCKEPVALLDFVSEMSGEIAEALLVIAEAMVSLATVPAT